LANAAHVKNVPGRKTDVNDATWLADLMAHGLIRASFVPDEPTQQMRDLLRTRKQFVRERSSQTQRIQKTLEDANIKLDSVIADIVGLSGRRMIKALIAGETAPKALAALAHGRIQATAAELTTIPGVRNLAAEVMVSEIGIDMSRFKTEGHLISWAGLCPKNDQSAGKRRSTRMKKGAPWLKTTLIQCAWAASRTNGCYLQAQYLRIRSRRGPKKAIGAVAASILTAAYHMLKDGTLYQDLGPSHFDNRDKGKQAKRLVNRLQSLGFAVQITSMAT
jgi:transposase